MGPGTQRCPQLSRHLGPADSASIDLTLLLSTLFWTASSTLADGLEPLSRARSIKTPDEISLIRQSCAIADVGLAKVKEAIKPGVTENDLFALLLHYNVSRGGERIDGKLLTAGGNTNPWIKRDASDRLVMPGNLVAIDTDMAGPLGYFADISRTYLCGDVQPNEEQMDAYKRAYDYIYSTIPYFVPGASFAEVAEKAPTIPPEYNLNRYPLMAHGAGMSDEWPAIYFKDPRPDEPSNYSGEIKENMVICMEASFGREHGTAAGQAGRAASHQGGRARDPLPGPLRLALHGLSV